MEISEKLFDDLSRMIRKTGSKLLGKVILVKPIIDKLNIASIIEKEIKSDYTSEDSKVKIIEHKNVSCGDAGEILILNRLTAPKPMYKVEKWVDEKTYTGELYGLKKGCMNDDIIANVLDRVHPHMNNIWNKIIEKATTEFGISFETVFNDITSTYFEGIYDKSDIIKYGYNRDQKPDKKQINIDVNANVKGIPLSYKILEGNTADQATVIGNMEDIMSALKETSLKKIRPLVVGDRAMLNEKIVIAYHDRDDMDYLGTLKLTKAMEKMVSEIPEEEYKIIPTDRDYGLYSGYMTTWKFGDKKKSYEDRILIVKSEQKALTDTKGRQKRIKKVEMKIKDLKEKLNKTIYRKIEKVEERVEHILKDERGGKYLNVEIKTNETKEITIEYTLNEELIKEAELLDGKYIIATNRMKISAKEMLKTYKKRDISEKDFEILKHTLDLRPIFLHKDNRIETLVFFTMCALLIYNILKELLKEAEITESISGVLDEFETVMVIYHTFSDGDVTKIIGKLTDKQADIIGKLKLGNLAQCVNLIP